MARQPENTDLTTEHLLKMALESFIFSLQGTTAHKEIGGFSRHADIYRERAEKAKRVLGVVKRVIAEPTSQEPAPWQKRASYLEALADEARDAFNACTPKALLDLQAQRRTEYLAAEHRLAEAEGNVL